MSAAQASAPPPPPPLHRRVRVRGVSGAFLRGVVTALSGASAGSQHVLLDVSWTGAADQLDARRLAHFVAATGALFGLSADGLVCHAGTAPAELTHGAPQPPTPMPLGQQQQAGGGGAAVFGPPGLSVSERPSFDRNAAGASSFGHGHGGGHGGAGFNSRASPELGPTGQFFRAHPPAPGSLPVDIGNVDAVSPMSLGGGGSGGDSGLSAVSGASPEFDLPRASASASPSIPSPPPLPVHLLAPRRQCSHDPIAAAASGRWSGGGRSGALLGYDAAAPLAGSVHQRNWHGSYGGGGGGGGDGDEADSAATAWSGQSDRDAGGAMDDAGFGSYGSGGSGAYASSLSPSPLGLVSASPSSFARGSVFPVWPSESASRCACSR